jgi:hypothetical protein
MDAVTLAVGAIGLGLKLWGGFSAMSAAKEAHGVESQITDLGNQVTDQKRIQMQMDAGRRNLEIFRRTQQLKAQSLAGATAGNSQFGSGEAGGQGAITSAGFFNAEGVNNNLAIGQNIFGLDKQISNQKLALSGIQTTIATDQGIGSTGSSMMGSAETVGKLSKGINMDTMPWDVFKPGAISGGLGTA